MATAAANKALIGASCAHQVLNLEFEILHE